MSFSRRDLLRAAGASVAVGSLLGGGVGTASAHAEVADDFRPAHESNYEDQRRTAEDVQWIVLHTIEGSYEAGVGWFQNPESDVSSHFVVGNEPDQITQMVHCEDVAWANGHGWYNDTAVSVDVEGVAGETDFNDHVYRQAAEVVRWVCEQYDVPKRHPTFDLGPCEAEADAGGIIGHEQIPDPDDCSSVVGGRSDPGDTWNWDQFMRLVNGEGCPGDVLTDEKRGSLSGTEDSDFYRYRVRTRDTCRASVDLSGPPDADFDLFVTLDGRRPTWWDHDRASTGDTSEESVVLGEGQLDADTTLGVAVRSYQGSGEYALEVTETGEYGFEEDQWVRTTEDGWGYQYPREESRRLERLSAYTHGQVVNGPVRNGGEVWWGLHVVNERTWVWVPASRLTVAPGGPRFTLGDRVRTSDDVAVRRRPGEDAAVVDRKPAGASGEVVDSATRVDGRVWWQVDFEDTVPAWCPGERLDG